MFKIFLIIWESEPYYTYERNANRKTCILLVHPRSLDFNFPLT